MFILNKYLTLKGIKMKKNNVILLVIMLLLLIAPNSIYVQDDLNKSINFYEMEAVPIDRLDTLPIEETYSFEEALNIMIESGVDKDFIETFKNNHEASPSKTMASGTERFQVFTMNGFTFDQGRFRYDLRPRIWVGLMYYDSGSPDHITSLRDAHVSTSPGYGNKNAVFKGIIAYHLVSGGEFSLLTYGDVFKEGTMTWEASDEVKVKEKGKASITICNGAGRLRDVSFTDTYYSSSLSR